MTALNKQIFWSRLIAVVEEQAQALQRTAFSTIVREAGDLSAGIFDARGRMMAQAVTGTPGHVNSMALTVGHVLRHFSAETMQAGDVYITNDPWLGTGHTNDFVLTAPCFHGGKLIALFACTSHVMDIGGINSTETTDVFQEGLQIPMLKIVDRGTVNETLMAMIRANSRTPLDAEGDTYSLIGCNDVGCTRLVELMEEFGLDDLEEAAEHIIEHSRNALREQLRVLPHGTWQSSLTLDGFDAPITLRASVTISADGVEVDYAGTDGAVQRAINVPLCYTTAYTAFGLTSALARNVPNNAGSLSLFSVRAPTECILNAQKPAAVWSRHIIGHMLPDLVFGCLRQAVPDRVPAEGAGTIWNIALDGARSPSAAPGENFKIIFTSSGGMGALPGFDGMSATAYPSGVRGTPVEIVESMTPLLFWRKELRPDSGGTGMHRGGLGQIIEIESTINQPFGFNPAYERIDNPPRGAAGGGDGAAGWVGLDSGVRLPGKGQCVIPPGRRLVVHTPGGGGLGDPAQRPDEAIATDLRHELVSPAT